MSAENHTPESISALVEIAKKDFRNGNFKNAIRKFEEAMQFYRNANSYPEAAEMANNLSVAYLQAKQKKV